MKIQQMFQQLKDVTDGHVPGKFLFAVHKECLKATSCMKTASMDSQPWYLSVTRNENH
jgi:hypothetical protein